MDHVFGKLLNLPCYSKIEGLLLFLSGLGHFMVLSDDEFYVFLHCFLVNLANIYWLLCSAYFYLVQAAKSILVFMAGMILATYACFYVRMEDLDMAKYGNLINYSNYIELAICLFFTYIMWSRALYCQPIIVRWKAIEKFCEEQKNFEWKKGSDRPEGFQFKHE